MGETRSLMDEIESGMYDDLINSEIMERENRTCSAGTADYMDWVVESLNKDGCGAIFDDDAECGLDTDKLSRLPALYDFLVGKFALMPECDDDGEFGKSVIYFSYRHIQMKMVQSYCGTDIITGIAISSDKKEYEELVLQMEE